MEIFANFESRSVVESWYPSAYLIRPVRGGYRVFMTEKDHETWWTKQGTQDIE